MRHHDIRIALQRLQVMLSEFARHGLRRRHQLARLRQEAAGIAMS